MLTVLVPMLISYLIDTTDLPSAQPHSKSLHDHALQKLMRIGPQYPAQFRTVMQTTSELRTRLEAAVKAQQASAAAAPISTPKNLPQSKPAQQPSKPSITLKTNFSNFTG